RRAPGSRGGAQHWGLATGGRWSSAKGGRRWPHGAAPFCRLSPPWAAPIRFELPRSADDLDGPTYDVRQSNWFQGVLVKFQQSRVAVPLNFETEHRCAR